MDFASDIWAIFEVECHSVTASFRDSFSRHFSKAGATDLDGLNGYKYLQSTEKKQETVSSLSDGGFSLEKTGPMR